MKPATSMKAVTKNGDSITIRLGDIFTISSELRVINPDVVHHYTALMLLTAAITQDVVEKSHSKIYFTMIGADKMCYTVAKITKNSIILVNRRGKESEIHKKRLVEAMHRFKPGETSIVAEGVRLYICTAISRPIDIEHINMQRMEARAMDLSKWPCSSIIVWARNHLGIPSTRIPKAKYMDDKTDVINTMIKISATRNANAPKLTESKPIGDNGQRLYETLRSGNVAIRQGSVCGVKFLNLRGSELAANNRPIIYAREDIRVHDLDLYMVICINNMPMWIVVSQEDRPDKSTEWKFHESDGLVTFVKMFDRLNAHWLVNKLMERANSCTVPAPEPEVVGEDTSPELGVPTMGEYEPVGMQMNGPVGMQIDESVDMRAAKRQAHDEYARRYKNVFDHRTNQYRRVELPPLKRTKIDASAAEHRVLDDIRLKSRSGNDPFVWREGDVLNDQSGDEDEEDR